jgi:hypothetical protein
MNPLSRTRALHLGFACAAALTLVAPAGARILPVDEESGSSLARSSWGAAAVVAKRETRAAAEKALLAQYGWGAAATYAKLHS